MKDFILKMIILGSNRF